MTRALILLGTVLASTWLGGSPGEGATREAITRHDTAVQILDQRVRDPFIQRGPDGAYYLTGTTAGSHWGETIGIRVWRSEDLAHWTDLGYVWDLNQDGRKQGSWHFDRPAKEDVKNGRAVWAPEIHYTAGTWWVPHCLNVAGHGLLKSTTGLPQGPYKALGMVRASGIDAHLFEDDGRVYYLWGADNIARMDDDLAGLAEAPRKIRPPGRHPLGYEGILLTRLGTKYVLFASGRYGYEPTDTYDLYYCVADDVYGPYGPRRMAIKNAGHGNVFQDTQGRWWATAFDHEFMTTKWAPWLVPIDVTVEDGDVRIDVLDPRFRPTEQDQQVVRHLAKTGIPEAWQQGTGRAPWDRK